MRTAALVRLSTLSALFPRLTFLLVNLGLGLVTSLVQRPDVVVFAGARDPSSSSLTSLASKYPGKLIPLKVVSADEVNNRAALEEIKQKAGRLDVVIANAGIATYYGSVVESPAQELRDHIEVRPS